MKTGIFLLLGLITAPVSAGTVLWNNIEAGMTKQQVRQLYPVDREHKQNSSEFFGESTSTTFDLAADCQATVSIGHAGNAVSIVTMTGPNTTRCAEIALDGLKKKYGEPTVDTQDSQTSTITKTVTKYRIPTAMTTVVDVTHRVEWHNGTVAIVYKASQGDEPVWSISYTVDKPRDADTSKL